MTNQLRNLQESDESTGVPHPIAGQRQVNPEMIAMARLATGLTQAECAQEMGVSQAKLSKLEDGITVSIEEAAIERLSKRSGYPMEFFTQPGGRVSLGDGFFRRRATVPARVFKRMEALINIKRMELSKLVRKVDLEKKERPSWSIDDFADGAREIARHLRHFWSLPAGPIKDLVGIVEDAGCIVVFFDFGTPKVDGLTIYCDDTTPVILLNPEASYVRQRATLSHELGHVIMHRMPTGNMDEEAFEFASEFMMPEQEIRASFFPMNVEKLVHLKIKWRVSMQWILRWGNKLGVIKDSYYRVLMMKISQHGWRKVEPYDSEWTLEKPTLLDDIIDFHRRDLEYSVNDFIRSIFPNVRTFEREYLKTEAFSVV
jgi:Zn-dependent peptidase ImmA (M78 family)/plasmid maintenance system antidote protein VapI